MASPDSTLSLINLSLHRLVWYFQFMGKLRRINRFQGRRQYERDLRREVRTFIRELIQAINQAINDVENGPDDFSGHDEQV